MNTNLTIGELVELSLKVARYTAINNHTEARIIIAEKFGFENLVSVFKNIEYCIKKKGYATPEVLNDSQLATKELFKLILINYGESISNDLYKAL